MGRAWVGMAVVASAIACGREPTLTREYPDAPAPVEHEVWDVRVPVPTPAPDYFDIVTPDVEIGPGQDKMLCLHVQTDRDLAVDNLLVGYGPNGHHVALFRTTQPKAPGTLEDCTSGEANKSLEWWIVTIALGQGRALWVPAGTQFVMQFHYINVGDIAMLVRDVARMHVVPEASVVQWVAPMTAQALDLAIPPGHSSRSWECVVPFDRQLLTVFGHMHELGARYALDIDDVRVHTVDPWSARLRDAPPQTMFWGSPLPLRAGSRLHVTCEYDNPGPFSVGYPAEMCLTFAYVAGGRDSFQCLPP